MTGSLIEKLKSLKTKAPPSGLTDLGIIRNKGLDEAISIVRQHQSECPDDSWAKDAKLLDIVNTAREYVKDKTPQNLVFLERAAAAYNPDAKSPDVPEVNFGNIPETDTDNGVSCEILVNCDLLRAAIYTDIEDWTLGSGNPVPMDAIVNAAQSIMQTIDPFIAKPVPVSVDLEKAARAMADVQRESEGKPPFSDEDWGMDFWDWYQTHKAEANGGSFVHQSWPAKLERQVMACAKSWGLKWK